MYLRDRKDPTGISLLNYHYSVIGVLVVSFLVVNYGGTVLFFNNTASMTQSLQQYEYSRLSNV